jgi:acetate kinase
MDALFVFNAGSSNLKLGIYDLHCRLLARGVLKTAGERTRCALEDAQGVALLQRDWTRPIDESLIQQLLVDAETATEVRCIAAGHRVVHGGGRFDAPVRADARVLRELEATVDYDPLHQPRCLVPLRALGQLDRDVRQAVCFDTAFHRALPRLEQLFGLPRALAEEGVRRYGFHGLSYEYIAGELPRLDAAAARGRTIVAHLGSGASLCALRDGRSVGTTMGFSVLDGLLMSSRCGSLDPGVLLYLMRTRRWDAERIERLLYRESGLLGLSGIDGDMQKLRTSEAPEAREALALYVYRLCREIGALTAVLGGVDALVFTGGIGEHDAELRAAACAGCAWLGLELDPSANSAHGPRLHALHSRVRAWVIPTDEDRVIARHSLALLGD